MSTEPVGDDTPKFLAFVEPEPNSGCWLWSGSVNPDGYAGFSTKRGKVRAHRWSYEHYRGEIPAGLEIDHLCRVRCCVNPQHLEAVTPRVNTLRGATLAAANAARTECAHGHSLSGVNLFIEDYEGSPKRRCRECGRERNRIWRAHPDHDSNAARRRRYLWRKAAQR